MLSLPLVAECPLDIFESIDLLLVIVIVISFLTDETFCNFSLTYFEIFSTSRTAVLFADKIRVFEAVKVEKIAARFHSTFLHIFANKTSFLAFMARMNTNLTEEALGNFDLVLTCEVVLDVLVSI